MSCPKTMYLLSLNTDPKKLTPDVYLTNEPEKNPLEAYIPAFLLQKITNAKWQL